MGEEKVKLLCNGCGISFARSDSLARHNRRIHNATKLEHVTCPEMSCNFTCARICHLDRHLVDIHSQHLEKECHHFRSIAEFEEWKRTIKQTEFYRYVLTGRRAKGQSYILRCHRSGHPEPSRATGKRPRKKGTIKIGRTCPSRMKVFESNTGVDVLYMKTHIGHGAENLFPKRRQKLDNEFFTKEDASSIDKIIQSWKEAGEERIVFYKPQGVVDECQPELTDVDCALAIMSQKQEEMLKLHAKSLICFDISNAIGPYRFYLGTLMVLDDNGEAFPGAFFFSNRRDQKMYEILFGAISARTGKLSSQVFISDDDVSYLNAWITTMGDCSKSLMCSWRVQQNWQKHLNNLLDATLRTNLKKELDSVLKEPDVETFQVKYNTLLHTLSTNPATKFLETHLMLHFSHRVEQWAYCFFVHSGLSHVIQLENLYKRIKKIYFGSKPGKPINHILNDLHQFTSEKRIENIHFKLEELPTKEDPMRANHIKSLEAPFNFIIPLTGGNFCVRSFTQEIELHYTVTVYKYDCDCNVVCADCSMCFHRYQCSCLEYTVNQLMCKHIHLVGRYLLDAHTEAEHNYANETCTTLLMLGMNNEIPTMDPEVVIEPTEIAQEPSVSVDHEKQNILMLMQEIKERCLETHSLETLEEIKNNLQRVIPSLTSTDSII